MKTPNASGIDGGKVCSSAYRDSLLCTEEKSSSTTGSSGAKGFTTGDMGGDAIGEVDSCAARGGRKGDGGSEDVHDKTTERAGEVNSDAESGKGTSSGANSNSSRGRRMGDAERSVDLHTD
jgi:hypothetical protein